MECDKEYYKTVSEATKAIVGKWRDHKIKMKWYRCNKCGGVHLATLRKNPQHLPKRSHSEYFVDRNGHKPEIRNPLPQPVKPTSFIHSTRKAISPEQAHFLKQLINNNQNEK